MVEIMCWHQYYKWLTNQHLKGVLYCFDETDDKAVFPGHEAIAPGDFQCHQEHLYFLV